jgi:glutaredoxin
MKITVYTITDCQYSKAEKEYLKTHNLQYEEKNLETNREFLTEMLAVGNNFAGTPVTKIEKDDGKIEVLKGFTAEEFDKSLGFAKAEPTKTDSTVPSTAAAPEPAVKPVADSAIPTPPPAAVPDTKVVEVASPAVPPPPQAMDQQPAASAPDPLADILNDLQQAQQAVQTETQPPVEPQPPAPPMATPPVSPATNPLQPETPPADLNIPNFTDK